MSEILKQKHVLEVLQNHRSIRHFLNKKVPDELIHQIVISAQSAPSSSHGQAYSIISVTDQHKKKKLAEYSGGQQHIEDCSHFFVFCADFYRIESIAKRAGIDLKESLENTEMLLVATVDAALAAQNAVVAAEALGLGIVYIGGIRNNPYEVTELLELPQRVYPVFGMCIGYPDPDKIPEKKPRLPQQAIFFENSYKQFDLVSQYIDEYDEVMRHYYANRSSGRKSGTWSETIIAKRKVPRRGNMRTFLKDRGFPLK